MKHFRSRAFHALVGIAASLCCGCAGTAPADRSEGERWTERDVSVLVTVADLEQFLNDPVSDAHTASWSKERTKDGVVRLRYDYFSLTHAMGLSWEVAFHPDVAAAERAVARLNRELERRERGPDADMERIDGFYAWGEESVFAVMKSSGETAGNFFFARYGATTVGLSLAGVYFYERSEFHRLVGPALANLLFYHPAVE